MAEEAAAVDPLAEENEPEVEETFQEEASESPASATASPTPGSPRHSQSPSQEAARRSQDLGDDQCGGSRPCGYKPKKRKVSYVWGPPKQRGREPSYSPCPHVYFKNMRENIQRDGLSRDDWMDILSTPNPRPWVKKGPNGEKLIRYRRKPCSKRTKQLAIPRIALVRANWEEYKGILSEDMLERLRQILADDFHMTPEEIKEFIKRGKQQYRVKRRKKKKKKKSKPVELTDEEWVRSLLAGVADTATDMAEYKRPSEPSGRLEEMITTILERLAAMTGEPPPPRDATGLVARLMIVIAEKLACWIESIVCEADNMPDETPCSQGLGLLSLLCCTPFCNTLKKMTALLPCCAEGKKGRKRRHSKSTKHPAKTTCCAKIREILEEEEPPPEPVRFPECKCACKCEQPRRRRRGRKKKKGKGKKRKHGADEEEEDSYDEEEGEEGEGGQGGGETDGGEGDDGGDDGDDGGDGGGGGGGGEDDAGGGGGGAEDEGDEGGADEGGGEEGGNEATDELKEGGSGGVGASKSSKGSSNKSAQSKTSANAAGSKSSANTGGSKASANAASSKGSANAAGSKGSASVGGRSKSATNSGASKSSANAGSGGGSKSTTNAAGSKSSANAGGGSKSTTNAGGSKSSANAGGTSKSSTNASKSKSSADAPKSKTSVKASASKASSKSKTDDGATAYKVTSGEEGVVKVEEQEQEPEEPPPPPPPPEEPTPDEETPPDENIEGETLEEKISELGEQIAQEAIDEGTANAAEGNLPNVTFGTILRQLSEIIEDLPEGEQSARKDKLKNTLEKKFTSLVENDEEEHSPEGIEEVVANVADKVATWMDDVIREAESRMSAASGGSGGAQTKPPVGAAQIVSTEVRDWADWIINAMGVAEEWSDWISTTVAAADEKASVKRGERVNEDGTVKKLTKAEWDAWKQSIKKEAAEFRKRKQSIKKTALEWESRTKGKKVIPSGEQPTSSNELQSEEEQKVTDMDGASEKSPTPDSPAPPE